MRLRRDQLDKAVGWALDLLSHAGGQLPQRLEAESRQLNARMMLPEV